MRRFFLVLIGLSAAASIASGYTYQPRVTRMSLQMAAASLNETVTMTFALAADAPPATRVLFEFTNGFCTRVLVADDPASGVAKAVVAADWLNGTYNLSRIRVQVGDKELVHYNNQSYSTDFGYLHAPPDGVGQWDSVRLVISGALAHFNRPTLVSLQRTSPATIAAGENATFTATIDPGDAKHWTMRFSVGDALGYWNLPPLVFSDTRDVTITVPTTKEWVTQQYNPGPITIEDEYGTQSVPDTFTGSPSSNQFSVTGGLEFYSFPAITSIARVSGPTVAAGENIQLSIGVTAGPSPLDSLTVKYVGLASSLQQTVSLTQPGNITVLIPTTAETPSYRYDVDTITLRDTFGRTATYYLNGTLAWGNLTHNEHNLGFYKLSTEVVGGFSIPPIVARGGVDVTVNPGDRTYLTVGVDTPVFIQYQWFEGEPGDTSTPVSTDLNFNSPVRASTTRYWVRATTAWGTVDSDAYTVRVRYAAPYAPVVNVQPQDGANATAIITGPAPVTYQWFKDGIAVPGATSASRPADDGTPANNGTYVLVATNPFGTTCTKPWLIDHAAAPALVSSPVPVTAAVGQSAAFSVVATGGNLQYVWQHDGTRIEGATDATLRIPIVGVADAGNYTVRASNGAGAVTTNPVLFAVSPAESPWITVDGKIYAGVGVPVHYTVQANHAPTSFSAVGLPPGLQIGNTGEITGVASTVGIYRSVITATNAAGSTTAATAVVVAPWDVPHAAPAATAGATPSTQHVAAGTTFALAPQVSGTEPLMYQWYHDNVAISGATARSYTITDASAGESGDYRVAIENAYGAATTSYSITVDYVPSPLTQNVVSGEFGSLSIFASPKVAYQWYVGETGDTSTPYRLSGTNPSIMVNGGRTSTRYWVRVFGGKTADSATATVTTIDAPRASAITAQPADVSLKWGETTKLSIAATGDALSYKWYKDGVEIPSWNRPEWIIDNASSANAGKYWVVVSNTSGTAQTREFSVAVKQLAQLTNLSIRAPAGTGDATLIIGFSIRGAGGTTKPLLVRGVGPTLAVFGVRGVLEDPQVTVYRGTTVVAANDDWGGNRNISALGDTVGAFGLAGDGSKDAALAFDAEPLPYTAAITGKTAAGGVALAEIYDLAATADESAPKLSNVSARCVSGVGDDVLIAGFNVMGETKGRLLVRGIGPALAVFGVGGVIPDPVLKLYHNGALVGMSDNWADGADMRSAVKSTGAFALPANSKDAALCIPLEPGTYSAQVSDAQGATGVALVEIYLVP